jgi:pilus assembly protein CpaC
MENSDFDPVSEKRLPTPTWLLVACVIAAVWGAQLAAAQEPPPAPAPSVRAELPPALPLPSTTDTSDGLPTVSLSAPQPLQKPGPSSFIDSLKGNDAAFDVVVSQGRILTVRSDITAGRNQPLIAVGDPSVVEFAVVSPRQIRITGLRVGVTDLSITTATNQTYSFEVRVVADLSLLTGKLRQVFPDASLRLAQLRDHVVVEGEARDMVQVNKIIETIQAYLQSVSVGQMRRIQASQGRLQGAAGAMIPGATTPTEGLQGIAPNAGAPVGSPLMGGPLGVASPEMAGPLQIQGTIAPPQVINLIRVPGSHQVLLKVRVAELNRTALRQIGTDLVGQVPEFGSLFGTNIPNTGTVTANGLLTSKGLKIDPTSATSLGTGTTAFGIFEKANFEFMLSALRKNAMLKILAEPNLMAMSGHQASFLAGGEFPVPVAQAGATGVPAITILWKKFGVQLNFVPYVMDGETIRLGVAPEVSQLDYALAVTTAPGASPVPGIATRSAKTTVELKQGQTLAIAGLLQLQMDGTTNRIPGLGDLPILGPFFSNTTSERIEKELVILVTPYLVEPMNACQVPPGPGDEVKDPNDLEFYLLNRIEGRTGKDFRATTEWDDPWHLVPLLKLEKRYVSGPSGYSD